MPLILHRQARDLRGRYLVPMGRVGKRSYLAADTDLQQRLFVFGPGAFAWRQSLCVHCLHCLHCACLLTSGFLLHDGDAVYAHTRARERPNGVLCSNRPCSSRTGGRLRRMS
jgi:hypothetical protein